MGKPQAGIMRILAAVLISHRSSGDVPIFCKSEACLTDVTDKTSIT